MSVFKLKNYPYILKVHNIIAFIVNIFSKYAKIDLNITLGIFMQVDDALLTRLEKLSFLKINDDKREEIKEQLSEIVSFVDNLSDLNTDGADENFAMSDASTRLREDKVHSSKTISEEILAHAPKSADDFFIVPKIIE
jgi:aspartyl-tRNA(Asn)/glutamyl-tRNA(Gln) amidotransferase subunit C